MSSRRRAGFFARLETSSIFFKFILCFRVINDMKINFVIRCQDFLQDTEAQKRSISLEEGQNSVSLPCWRLEVEEIKF